MNKRTMTGAVGALAVTWGSVGIAAGGEPGALDAGAEAADGPEVAAERDSERYRLNLALDLSAPAANVGLGGLGGLVAPLVPRMAVGFEVRLAGPAWLLLDVHGSVAGNEGEGVVAASWSTGATAGVRLEEAVSDLVSVGGYGVLFADGARNAYEQAQAGVGASFGAAVHIRPTSFFGVRLALGLLRASVERTYDSYTDSATWGGAARLTAAPQLALTFTL